MTGTSRRLLICVMVLGGVSIVGGVLPEGKTIPNFSTLLVDRQTLTVSVRNDRLTLEVQGDKGTIAIHPKVLVIDFWATWCPYCRVAEKWLKRLYAQYREKGLEILAISVDEDGRRSVRPYLLGHPIPYLVALDARASVANRMKVTSLPTLYIVDAKGTIRSVFAGIRDEASLRKEVIAAGLK